MKTAIAFLITIYIILLSTVSCDTTSKRVDSVENKALENLCNSRTLEKILEVDKQVAREYLCQCQQGAKKSDQNLCESIVNFNNSKAIVELCKKDRECIDIVTRRK